MIITKEFVLLNNPKTGSSFLRALLKDIHKTKKFSLTEKIKNEFTGFRYGYKELLLPNYTVAGHPKSQHASYWQIPKKYQHLPVYSVIRNPYGKYESLYFYGWWKKKCVLPKEQIITEFPNFPKISFTEFLKLKELEAISYSKLFPNNNLGVQTLQFLYMFFNRPKDVINDIIENGYKDEHIEYFGNVQFLQQETLRDDLHHMLSQYDYTSEQLNMIYQKGKVNVSSDKKPIVWSQENITKVKELEKPLFLILKKLNIDYNSPKYY